MHQSSPTPAARGRSCPACRQPAMSWLERALWRRGRSGACRRCGAALTCVRPVWIDWLLVAAGVLAWCALAVGPLLSFVGFAAAMAGLWLAGLLAGLGWGRVTLLGPAGAEAAPPPSGPGYLAPPAIAAPGLVCPRCARVAMPLFDRLFIAGSRATYRCQSCAAGLRLSKLPWQIEAGAGALGLVPFFILMSDSGFALDGFFAGLLLLALGYHWCNYRFRRIELAAEP